mmetsp:Transcript_24674/g.35416  ORF Transcript_24674/g.35416 Transcript_24674/m.35416 type:complete len:153 (-) Transcript_24674:518-976(-)
MATRGRNEDISNLDVVERFESYEDYLDSQLTATDMGYLEDEEMARQLVELGYRGLGDTLRREVSTDFTDIGGEELKKLFYIIFNFYMYLFAGQIQKDFESRKKILLERTSQKHLIPKQLSSVDKDFSKFPFLQVLLLISKEGNYFMISKVKQ